VSDGKGSAQELNKAMIERCCWSGNLDQAGYWAIDWKHALI